MIRYNNETQQFGLDHEEMALAATGVENLLGLAITEDRDAAQVTQECLAILARSPQTPLEAALHAVRDARKEHTCTPQGIGRDRYWLPDASRLVIIDALRYSADHAADDPLASRIPSMPEQSRLIARTAIAQLERFSDQALVTA